MMIMMIMTCFRETKFQGKSDKPSMQKIYQNMGFLSPAYSRIRTESMIFDSVLTQECTEVLIIMNIQDTVSWI